MFVGFDYSGIMTAKLFKLGGLSRAHRLFLEIAWAVILIKCVVVAWAIPHWNVPINALWVILPTLTLAAVATALTLRSRE